MAGRFDHVGGIWQPLKKRYDKVGGVWQPTKKRWDKAGGVWQPSCSNGLLTSIYQYQWCYIGYTAQRLNSNNIMSDSSGLHMNASVTGMGSSSGSQAYLGVILQIPLGQTITFPANTKAVELTQPLTFTNTADGFPLDLIIEIGTAMRTFSKQYYNNGDYYNDFYNIYPVICNSQEVSATGAGAKQFADTDLNTSLPTSSATSDCIYLNITWDASCGSHNSYNGSVSMDIPNEVFKILPDSLNIPIKFS